MFPGTFCAWRSARSSSIFFRVTFGLSGPAALVYRTDAAPGRVRTVRVPPRANVRAQYLIGVVAGAENAAGAERWAGFVASPEGRRILSRHGFLTDVTTAQ